MSQPVDKPQRRRRKKLTREERAARAEYMRHYRADSKAPIDEATPTPIEGSSALSTVPATDAPAAPSAPPGLTIEKKTELLSKALGGTVEVCTDMVQLVLLDAQAPHFGHDRSQTLGSLWAPILAPYMTEKLANWLPLILAGGGTAQAAYAWAHEYSAYRESKEKAQAKRLELVHDGVVNEAA